jgi:hypothetical protein
MTNILLGLLLTNSTTQIQWSTNLQEWRPLVTITATEPVKLGPVVSPALPGLFLRPVPVTIVTGSIPERIIRR